MSILSFFFLNTFTVGLSVPQLIQELHFEMCWKAPATTGEKQKFKPENKYSKLLNVSVYPLVLCLCFICRLLHPEFSSGESYT